MWTCIACKRRMKCVHIVHIGIPFAYILLVQCGIVWRYVPCWERVKLKNELVLSKCIIYELWPTKVSRICMKAWKIHCLQWMFILVNFTNQNWNYFLLFIVNCKTKFAFIDLFIILKLNSTFTCFNFLHNFFTYIHQLSHCPPFLALSLFYVLLLLQSM
jgi:hypothetical protein